MGRCALLCRSETRVSISSSSDVGGWMGEIDSSSKHWTEMSLYKWCWICFFGGLIGVIGLPTAVKAEVSTETTVKECRIHIEKALEQYWDEKETTDDQELDEKQDTANLGENLNERTQRILRSREINLELNKVGETDKTTDLDKGVGNAEEVDDSTNRSADEDIDDDDDDGASDAVDDNGDDADDADEDIDDDDEETDDDGEDTEDDDDETIDDSTEKVVTAEEEDTDEDSDDVKEDAKSPMGDVNDQNVEDVRKEETNERSMESKDDDREEEAHSQPPEEDFRNKEDISVKEPKYDDTLRTEGSDSIARDSGGDEKLANQSLVDDDSEKQDSEDVKSDVGVDSIQKDKITDEIEIKKDYPKEEKVGADHKEQEGTINIGEKKIESPANEETVIKVSSEKSELEKHEDLREERKKIEERTKEINASSEETHREIPSENAEQKKHIHEESSQDQKQVIDSIELEEEDSIENIYEDEEQAATLSLTFRSRDHVDAILGLDEIETEYEKQEEELAQSIFKEIKKIEMINIKPMELLYKYADSTTRVLGDAEIFNKPMLLFLGPWSAGKTSIINYILGLERTDAALTTGTGITDVDFTLLTYGNTRRLVSGTELAADWRYSGVQKFGQSFLDHFRSIHIPHTLLKQVTIVDTPGILENRKNSERGYSLNDAFQWFIDRADAIYIVLDPTKVDIGGELAAVVDQLKGRDVRFILNKADMIRRSDLMRIVGQLFWNLSPLMSSTEAPVIYAVSLTTHPYHPSAPVNFLADQEKNLFYDMKTTLDKRVENKILYARKHAVRVRNHAKMVDCYLATYYRHKSIFSNKRNVAKLITENPRDYNIYDGLSSMTNISRYDIPNPLTYKEFFKMHPLYDFKPLASTCSYFRGCPMEKLDLAISKDIPELLAKYKKEKSAFSEKLNR